MRQIADRHCARPVKFRVRGCVYAVGLDADLFLNVSYNRAETDPVYLIADR